MGSKYELEPDHIFPFSKLKGVGYGKENRVKYALAQELTNRAIITKVANRTKSDSNAIDSLRLVESKFPKALELQCIPEDENLWEIENYEQFLEKRRKMLAEKLNKFLNEITKTEEMITPVSIEDLILEGESGELEFKSTLRWDTKEGALNKKLEEVIIKTVAAFANSQGGTLLIGVADNGEVLGLDADYNSMGGESRDNLNFI